MKNVGRVAEALDLDDYVIEKDVYVTQAIALVSDVSNDLYELVFQGGTSLSKAHQIIDRMSEDCDFRICLKTPNHSISKSQSRKILRQFRHELIDQLKRVVLVLMMMQCVSETKGNL